ncbi:hypothetical protein LEP1GSC016_3229 [Leptospira borgpetersenii serovar Hardjo-bovis str. Sponselee]|uniref:Uncharacterized protein n=1 Tax=Leptospira borgpetersenii serovar Hardjo-bovis str. Sponselee TaxID=1303729 RepID=M6BLC0_LEPBO|nr:hypothetical protein LEP1GSC016_3229 [Leptospira borgpetersenii serovar Hardjo-bovis str. Sponselee]
MLLIFRLCLAWNHSPPEVRKQQFSFPTANLEIRGRVANDKFRLFFSLFSEIFLFPELGNSSGK